MAGFGSNSSPGNICHVFVANCVPKKNKTRKSNKDNSAPITFQFWNKTFHLKKRETVDHIHIWHTGHAFPTALLNMIWQQWKMHSLNAVQMVVYVVINIYVYGIEDHKYSQLYIITAQSLI
jgi:hypothetical protein